MMQTLIGKDQVMYLYKGEQIDKHIVAVERDAGKLQDKIHALGVSILKDWHDSKGKNNEVSCDRLNRLCKASPYHARAFTQWVGMFTPLVWNEEEKLWVTHSENTKIMGKVFMEARDTPFWKVSPPPQAKPFDIFDYIEKGMAKSKKHRDNPIEGDVVDASVESALREVLALRNK